jgi:hypothetical protein
LSLLLHAPILVPMLRFFAGGAGVGKVAAEWTSLGWMVEAAIASLGLGPWLGGAVAAAGSVLLLLGVGSYWRQDRFLPGLFLLPVAVGFVLALVLQRNLWPRFFFFAMPFLVLLGVRSAMVLARRVARWRRPDTAVVGEQVAVIGLVVVMASLLPSVYRLPKQDFAGARDYVRSSRTAAEPVVTVGLAIWPYRWLYEPTFHAIESAGALRALLDAGQRVWLLNTLPIFLESRQPELAALVARDFEEAARFRGSVGGGDVVVFRSRER